MDKVSVVIPVYNGEKDLIRCIDSLLNQSYKNNEYIFVNDGSTDKTLNILKDYSKKDKRIVIIDKKNTGVSDSRNKGIEKSTGDYICFCDADDIYKNNYIESMLSLIKKNNVSAVRCNFDVINKLGNKIDCGKNYFVNQKLDNQAIKSNIIPLCLNGKIPCFSTLLMIRKDMLKTFFPTGIAMMEDVVFYINFLLNIDSLFIITEPLYTIIFNEKSATNNVKNYERNINNVLLVNKNIKEILKNNNLLNKENINKLNLNHLDSISDFIFKNYLYGDNTINLIQNIRSFEFISLIDETNLSEINFARRIILKLIKNKNYILLRIYFFLRKIIFNIKRRNL